MKTRKQNRISANPQDLLNNFKYIKSDKKTQQTTIANFKKSTSGLKRFDKNTFEEHLALGAESQKKQSDSKPYTYRSPEKKTVDQQRKSEYLKKPAKRSLSRNDNKSIEKQESLNQIYGRTIRFKTTATDLQKMPKSNISEKHKILLDTFTPSRQKTFKKIMIDLNDKFNILAKTFENNGSYGTFVPDLVNKFKDIMFGLLEALIGETVEKIEKQEKHIQEYIDRFKDIAKENLNLQTMMERLKEQNQFNKKELSRYRKVCEKQKQMIIQKMQKQRQVNSLLYELRQKAVNIDIYYRNINLKSDSQQSRNQLSLGASNKSVTDNSNLTV